MSHAPKEVPGPCAACGRDAICADFEGRALCQDDWHAAREKTPPYAVRRVDTPEYVAKFGHYYTNGTLTRAEAEDFAQELVRRYGGRERWEAVPAKGWWGERIAHPGYMARRRASILAEHPEYNR